MPCVSKASAARPRLLSARPVSCARSVGGTPKRVIDPNLDRSPAHTASHLVVYVDAHTHKEEKIFVFCSVAYLRTK